MKMITNTTCNRTALRRYIYCSFYSLIIPGVSFYLFACECQCSTADTHQEIFFLQKTLGFTEGVCQKQLQISALVLAPICRQNCKSHCTNNAQRKISLCRVSAAQDCLWCLDKLRDYLIVLVVVHTQTFGGAYYTGLKGRRCVQSQPAGHSSRAQLPAWQSAQEQQQQRFHCNIGIFFIVCIAVVQEDSTRMWDCMRDGRCNTWKVLLSYTYRECHRVFFLHRKEGSCCSRVIHLRGTEPKRMQERNEIRAVVRKQVSFQMLLD